MTWLWRLLARWRFGLPLIGSPMRHFSLYSKDGQTLGQITGWDKVSNTFTVRRLKRK